MRHAVDLLGEADVVRKHLGEQRRAAARERDRQLVSGTHQARPLRRLAGEQRRLGAVARPVLGNAASGMAMPRLRPRHLRGVDCRAVGTQRTGPDGHGPAPAVRRRSDDPVLGVRGDGVPRGAGARRLVRLGVDARRPIPLSLRERGDVRQPIPRRLHLRGDRPNTRLVLFTAGRQHARVRKVAVPQRRVPRAHCRRERPEDVEVAREHHGPVVGARHARRRGAALVHGLLRIAVDDQARVARRRRRSDAQVPPDAVEHVLVLHDIREPRRVGSR